jgi:outer membrane protein OmpA-like peptidoglycan-associated protein
MSIMKNVLLILFLSVSCKFSYAQNDSSITQVYFKFGKFGLSGSSTEELDKLIPGNSKLERIKITGQTDQFGTNSFNDRLSLSRANEVYRYLVKSGLDSSLTHEIVGYGKRNLFAAGAEPKANTHQLNRVVVITSYYKQNVENVSKAKEDLNSKQERKPIENQQKSFEQQLKEGSSNIVLNNLNFVGGRHVLLPASVPVLENILETMKKYPTLEVEIQGHICCTIPSETDGPDLDTGEKVLSVNRAKAIFEYLVANGIGASRMTYKGFGAQNRLIYPERNEADASTNRRVEFKITKR